MANGVQVEVAERDKRAVVVKTATGNEAVSRLQREADRLDRARHPGVVELLSIDHRPGADGPPMLQLVLAWAGGQTLETARPGVAGATALLSSLASTVAHLHAVGLVHGRLDATHVVVDAHGRPRLCGLAGPEGDPERPELTPADDVAALGRLVERLVGTGAEAEPIPEHRWARRRWNGFQVRALQTLADQATATDPDRRPTARALATSLRDLAPDARVEPITAGMPASDTAAPGADAVDLAPEDHAIPSPPVVPPMPAEDPATEVGPATFLGMRIAEGIDAEGDAATRRRLRPPGSERPVAPSHRDLVRGARSTTAARAGVVALFALAAIVVGLHLSRPGGEQVGAAVVEPTSTVVSNTPDGVTDGAEPATTAAVPSAAPATTWPERCASDGEQRFDVDGDGCPDAARVVGSTITVGTATYAIGGPDDQVSLGDWDCDGTATPVVLRPTSGEVFVFSSWPAADEPITRQAVTTVPVGTTLDTAADGPCGRLDVRLADGSDLVVSLDEEPGP